MALKDEREYILDIIKCGSRYDKQPLVFQAGFDQAAEESINIIIEFMYVFKDLYSANTDLAQYQIESVLKQMLLYKDEKVKELMGD